MTITETPFLAFWRVLNAELAKLGEPPAIQGIARSFWMPEPPYPPDRAAWIIQQQRSFSLIRATCKG
jgi:hypothetical protein